jgi:putative ABC transport system substrate-binding protein
MNRRKLICFLSGAMLIGPTASFAQTSRPHRLGVLTSGPSLDPASGRGAMLVAGLAKRGYKLGINLTYETRGAAGKLGDIPELVQQLKAANVDAIVTVGYPTAVAARASGIPTVLASGAGDPVATGLVQSLAHPGGNVTGISDDAALLSTKRLGLLKEMAPSLRRIAMLWNRDDLAMSLRFEASAKAADEIGVTVQRLGVREPDDFDEAFAAMKREPPDAILMVSDSLTVLNRRRVMDFAAQRRIPAIYETERFAHEGGLMSYGADDQEIFDRVAGLVHRTLQGVKPADLPVEQPTRYLFVRNLKTAKAINLTVPSPLLTLADQVIE